MDAQFIVGLFLLSCCYKLSKFKMADKMAAKSCFIITCVLVQGFEKYFWKIVHIVLKAPNLAQSCTRDPYWKGKHLVPVL